MTDVLIRALVFDFGGVFTRSEVSQQQLRRYDEMLKLPPDTLQSALYSGEPWEQASTGRISQDVYWARAGKVYEDRLPVEFRAYRQGLFWAEPINEDMVALAQNLHRHYPLALCSNALPEIHDILAGRPDLDRLFDAKIISVAVGLRKPDPAIFRLCAQRLRLPIEACLLIDDKERNTVAAKALGMPAVVFESVAQLHRDLVARGLQLDG